MVSADLNLESLPSHCLSVSRKSGSILSHSSRETSLIRLAAVALGVELGTLPFSSSSSLPPCTPSALVSVSSLADDGMRVGLFAFSPLRGEMRRSGEGEGGGGRERGPSLIAARLFLPSRPPARRGARAGGKVTFLPAGFPSLPSDPLLLEERGAYFRCLAHFIVQKWIADVATSLQGSEV